MPATGWTNHDAAVAVARRTELPAADRKAVLAMLDLLGPDQHCPEHGETHATIAPDQQRPVTSATQLSIHGSGNSLDSKSALVGLSTRVGAGPALNGRLCPPGLAAVIQGAAPAAGPVPAAPQAPQAPPAADTAEPPPPTQPQRGKRIPVADLPPIPPDAHGSYRGVSLHRRRHELSCRTCKDFTNAQARRVRASRAAHAA